MATVELTAENFNSTVSGEGLVLVDFWAEWCGPCRMFGPIFEQASERHADAVFGKVDTEAQPEVAATFKIASIPTLMIIRDNVVLFQQPGALPEAALEQLITKAKELDMDEIRAEPCPRRLAPDDLAPDDTPTQCARRGSRGGKPLTRGVGRHHCGPAAKRARGGGSCAGRWPGTPPRTRPSPGR